MRSWRALWASMAIWAFLGWMYVISRILLYPEIGLGEDFIMGIPISFWMLGIGWYVIGFIATWRALCGESP